MVFEFGFVKSPQGIGPDKPQTPRKETPISLPKIPLLSLSFCPRYAILRWLLRLIRLNPSADFPAELRELVKELNAFSKERVRFKTPGNDICIRLGSAYRRYRGAQRLTFKLKGLTYEAQGTIQRDKNSVVVPFFNCNPVRKGLVLSYAKTLAYALGVKKATVRVLSLGPEGELMERDEEYTPCKTICPKLPKLEGGILFIPSLKTVGGFGNRCLNCPFELFCVRNQGEIERRIFNKSPR